MHAFTCVLQFLPVLGEVQRATGVMAPEG
jgi:hypothetical protein